MKKSTFSFVICAAIVFFISNGYSQKPSPLLELQSELSRLINHAKHSIVTVNSKTTRSYTIDKSSGIISLFWNNTEEKKDQLKIVGSGIIYNKNGYIITKSSTLANFEEIFVITCDSTEYAAEYIGTDELTGLSIIKIDAQKLKPATFGDSDNTPMYSMILVVGNSMGISPFASFGIVNSVSEQGMFVISAAINPGSNGAGAFNINGELIGIVSAQLFPDAFTMGPAFFNYSSQNAIILTSNQIRSIAAEIIKAHHEQKGWLGIDINIDSLVSGKIVISKVIPGSPAHRAGLKPGDWLLKYNNNFLKDLDEFAHL
ncbi:MAG TPA: PDZ domain-containing protein, partial [bacterium]|nr:PDZ domain-containing protein [bacterium]